MKSLLTITALFEGLTGLTLAIIPSFFVSLLLNTQLSDPGAILVCRLTGGALMTIAIACWLSRSDTQSSIMVKVMLGYNAFTIALLVYAAFVDRIYGPGLWPALLFHLVLLIWCVSALRKQV